MKYLVVDRYAHLFAKTCALHTARILAQALSNEEENIHERVHVLEQTANGLKGRGYYVDGVFYDYK